MSSSLRDIHKALQTITSSASFNIIRRDEPLVLPHINAELREQQVPDICMSGILPLYFRVNQNQPQLNGLIGFSPSILFFGSWHAFLPRSARRSVDSFFSIYRFIYMSIANFHVKN
jgi:hypothetical protein